MKLIKRFLLVLLLIIIIVCTVIFLNGYKLYKITISETSLSDKVEKIKQNDSYVSIKNVPEYYINAIIAVEDHRFKDHGPVDYIAIRKGNLF